jgi:glycosyltransferase involved in cell wall biosynthesis
MKRVAIISFKFSPGLCQHAIAYAKAMNAIGLEPELILNYKYKSVARQMEFSYRWHWDKEEYISTDIFMFINIHPYNIYLSRQLKREGKKIIYLYHEPWDGINNYKKEDAFQMLKAMTAHTLSCMMLRYSSVVIVPSMYALNNYTKSDIRYNKNCFFIPLLFDDELSDGIDLIKKQYFSYIGHAVRGHGFDYFIKLVEFIAKIDSQMKFCIATSTDLSQLIERNEMIKNLILEQRLILRHGKPLSNDQINKYYEESFCIYNMYRRTTQSGVLPKAFMFGVPVLASDIGSFPEFVEDGENGFIVKNRDEGPIYNKLKIIRENIYSFSMQARRSFERYFYWKNNINMVKEMVDKLYGYRTR